MVLLIESIADDSEFFVEDVQVLAIVFDNTDDVTVWATTFFDQELHFFHLALPFHALDTLMRHAADRAAGLQEDVADALAAGQWPALLEYNSEEVAPVALPKVALKLSITYAAAGPDDELESNGLTDETDDPQPHNIFYLEGIYLRVGE